jgi:phosphoribosylaminoimidazole-succinocarboxamide synthase
MNIPAVHQTNLPGLINRGKVRDIYALDDEQMLIVASDRISAFDVVMAEPVPGKGVLLTKMSEFWLRTLPACQPHHLEYVVSVTQAPPRYAAFAAQLAGRAMVVKRVPILPIECIVRGYIIGSGWKEYQASGAVSGVKLPAGLRKADRLPQPIFTPSTKAAVGHDELITFDGAVQAAATFIREQKLTRGGGDAPSAGEMGGRRGSGAAGSAAESASEIDARELMEQVRDRALAIYQQAAAHAEQRGIILADTKFEFGWRDGQLLLADEVLTPDSSRFWPADRWQPGQDPPSFDKQFLRDYLETLSWPKQPPPPKLPAEIVEKTAEGYAQAYELLTK